MNQTIFVLKMMQKYFIDEKLTSGMFDINAFVNASKIESFNLNKLHFFLKSSKIANKLQGFSRQALKKEKKDLISHSDPAADLISIHESPMRFFEDFVAALSNPDKDGRVLVTKNIDVPRKIQYILLNPSDLFSPIVSQARSVILAGGTMDPMSDFINDLLPSFKKSIHTYSCGHVIGNDQLLPICLPLGPQGITFKLSYEERNKPDLILEMGRALANLTAVIPGGIVLFFASYSYMNLVFKNWKASGIIEGLSKRKQIFVEPTLAAQTESCLRNYVQAINNQSDRMTGAILLAVVGGKMSEGINFSDSMARAVIMIGVPFANIKSQELKEKMAYMDSKHQTDGGTSGAEYYENICMKSVNQCIGRAIRHRNDYACIILMDERYQQPRIRGKLPKWIVDCGICDIKIYGDCISRISKFFKNKV